MNMSPERRTVAAEFGDHRWSIDELDAETVRALREMSPEQWESFAAALESTEPAYAVDWQDLPPADDLAARLTVMARVKTIVPVDNIEVQKDVHNVTVENHVKLLLDAAGTRDNLRVFLELGKARLAEPSEPESELAKQAFLIWSPAAEVMGWYGLKEKLERAAFETMFPGEKTRITETYAALGGDAALRTATERYERAIRREVSASFPELAGQIGITARRKSYYGVWRKCAQRGQGDYLLSDFIGVRVTVNSESGEDWAIEQCYAVVGAVSQLFEPELDRYKDYIARPKPNGYQSFHMTLREPTGARLEVQVRTAAMHDRAEGDPDVSHMAYEASSKLTPGKYFRGGLNKPQRTYRWREAAAVRARQEPEAELSELRPRELLVFAPDGNLYNLPEGATALDCAFRIHSRRALRTKRISVNGKPARFDDPVSVGDVVAIEYAPKRPDQDGTWKESWLQVVNTPRARRRIQVAAKERDAQRYRQQAREEVAARFPDIEDPIALLTPEDCRRVLRKYSVQSLELVLREIGAGVARSDSLVQRIARRVKKD